MTMEEDMGTCCQWWGRLANGKRTKKPVEDRCLQTLVLCHIANESLS